MYGHRGQTSKPFVLSLSKHEWLCNAPFNRLRVNGDETPAEKYVHSIMNSLVTLVTLGTWNFRHYWGLDGWTWSAWENAHLAGHFHYFNWYLFADRRENPVVGKATGRYHCQKKEFYFLLSSRHLHHHQHHLNPDIYLSLKKVVSFTT